MKVLFRVAASWLAIGLGQVAFAASPSPGEPTSQAGKRTVLDPEFNAMNMSCRQSPLQAVLRGQRQPVLREGLGSGSLTVSQRLDQLDAVARHLGEKVFSGRNPPDECRGSQGVSRNCPVFTCS